MSASSSKTVPENESDMNSSCAGSSNEAELEAPDYETTREQVLRQILTLEKQFQQLRHELCDERLRQVDRRMCEVKEGSACEYRRRVDSLLSTCKAQCEVAHVNKQFRIAEIDRVYESAQLAAAQDRENEERLLVDKIKTEIESRISKLKADKHAADVNLALWMQEQQEGHNAKIINQSKSYKQANVNQPFIVYMLKQKEIEDDCNIIKRAIFEAEFTLKNL